MEISDSAVKAFISLGISVIHGKLIGTHTYIFEEYIICPRSPPIQTMTANKSKEEEDENGLAN